MIEAIRLRRAAMHAEAIARGERFIRRFEIEQSRDTYFKLMGVWPVATILSPRMYDLAIADGTPEEWIQVGVR